MTWTVFWKHFSYDFEFQSNHLTEKMVLFDLCKAKLASLFRSESIFSRAAEIGQMTSHHPEMDQHRGDRPQ